jgi:hypothetical protein
MSDTPLWYGYLDAGEKSSAVLQDQRLSTGNPDTVYLFNLARGRILEYRRSIVESKLREFTPEEAAIIAELEAAFGEARRGFTPRTSRTPPMVARNQAPAPAAEPEEPEEPDAVLDLESEPDDDWPDDD